ncbi:putative metalloprotease [uncultured archaeon]|nr:putative metalloprotease [uncultured archaeon]
MKEWAIRQGTLESIIMVARKVYPDEFFSMLGGAGGIIEELVIVPAEFGEDSVVYRHDLVPFDKKIIGTVHSHPGKWASPSEDDLESFRKAGEVHLIIGYPYDLNTIKAFDTKGNKITLKVVE